MSEARTTRSTSRIYSVTAAIQCPRMPNSKLRLIEDVEFIFAEAVRFKELEKQWVETRQCPEELKQAAFSEIKFPGEPHRRLTVGRAAIRRLEQLAGLAARRAGIQDQVEI